VLFISQEWLFNKHHEGTLGNSAFPLSLSFQWELPTRCQKLNSRTFRWNWSPVIGSIIIWL